MATLRGHKLFVFTLYKNVHIKGVAGSFNRISGYGKSICIVISVSKCYQSMRPLWLVLVRPVLHNTCCISILYFLQTYILYKYNCNNKNNLFTLAKSASWGKVQYNTLVVNYCVNTRIPQTEQFLFKVFNRLNGNWKVRVCTHLLGNVYST